MQSPSFRITIVGTVLAAFSLYSAFAQAEQAPNPFGNSAQATAPAPSAPTPKKKHAVAVPKAGQFTTEAEAKASCPSDTVVWVNTGTKVYHYAGNAAYGKTKRGAYVCEKDTAASGYHAAKREKKPS